MAIEFPSTFLTDEMEHTKFHLFSIGINTYQHHRNLRSAEKDAQDIAKLLTERYGFEEENNVVLLGKKATANAIDRQLRKYAKDLSSKDALVLFYAGHGQYDQSFTDGTYLIPYDASLDSTALWIDHDKVRRYFGAIKARHILLISDSCFSGGVLRWTDPHPEEQDQAYFSKAIRKTSRQAITSGGIEAVEDRGFQGNSVFTHFLLDTLSKNQKQLISPFEIFEEIRDGVAHNASQSPEFGRLFGAGDGGGDFVLSRSDRLARENTDKNHELPATDHTMEVEQSRIQEIDDENSNSSITPPLSKKEQNSGDALHSKKKMTKTMMLIAVVVTIVGVFAAWQAGLIFKQEPWSISYTDPVSTEVVEVMPNRCPTGFSGGYISSGGKVMGCGGWEATFIDMSDGDILFLRKGQSIVDKPRPKTKVLKVTISQQEPGSISYTDPVLTEVVEVIPDRCPAGFFGGYISSNGKVLGCGGWKATFVDETDGDFIFLELNGGLVKKLKPNRKAIKVTISAKPSE